ncbi:MAG: O-antigen ligase family protein [Candidatus Omnitrophota bacterium]|nr:O-antigen ligase family protein [Candidatus Omnitrophota bacterium]
MVKDKNKKYFLLFLESFLIFLIIFTPLFYGSVEILPLTIIELTSFLFLLLLFLNLALSSSKIFYPAYIYILIIFIFVAILQLIPFPNFLLKVISSKTLFLYERYSDYLSPSQTHHLSLYSLPTKEEIAKFIAFFIIFFGVMNVLKKKSQFRRLILMIIFLGLILSLYGVAKKYFILGKETARSFSTFGNRNHYAGYMVMIAPMAIAYALYSQNNFKKIIFGFIGAIISASIFLSLSRAGSLSLVFSLTLMSFLLIREGTIKKTYWIIGILVILGIIFISLAGLEPIRDRFMLSWQGLFGRWKIVRDSFGMFRDFPLFGIGWGNFRYIFPLYQTEAIFPTYYKYLHNDHFQLVVELGLVGSALYFIFLFKIFKDIFIELNRRHDYFVKGIVLGGICGLSGVIFHSFFDFNFHIPATSFLFWLILGLIYKCVHTHFYNSTGDYNKTTKDLDERKKF